MDRPNSLFSLDMLVTDCSIPGSASGTSPMKLLAEAEVVYAVDPETQRDILVLGREKLREVADSDLPQAVRVMRVTIGGEGQRLERLLALVRQTRGYHDYEESA